MKLGLAAVGVAIATGVYAMSLFFDNLNANDDLSKRAKSNFEILGAQHFMTNFDSKRSFDQLEIVKRRKSRPRRIKVK